MKHGSWIIFQDIWKHVLIIQITKITTILINMYVNI
jgi:hypothetical protein